MKPKHEIPWRRRVQEQTIRDARAALERSMANGYNPYYSQFSNNQNAHHSLGLSAYNQYQNPHLQGGQK